VILALAASLALVVQDHTALRAAPRSNATELTSLWQGDVLEVRSERAGYLQVYNYRRERCGYLLPAAVRSIGLNESDAPGLLAVMRFLRDGAGSEALGISYGAAYLKAIPGPARSAEALDAIATMAERLADQASGAAQRGGALAAHLEVVEQFGVRVRSFERDGRMQVCYDGELFRRLLSLPQASAEQRARAALSLTRTDCIDPSLGPQQRALFDEFRRDLLAQIAERGLNPTTRSRLHARRAAVWAGIAYQQARRGLPAELPAQQALNELISAHPDEFGEAYRKEYLESMLRVAAVRWAATAPAVQAGPLLLRTRTGEPGQTCLILEDTSTRPAAMLLRRCTYGIVWFSSLQALVQARALVVAVQPLESWRELWVFHASASGWIVDVISPGYEQPEEGYVEFAGFAPASGRLLLAREVHEHGRFRRRFEEHRLSDLALVKDASAPELLPDFGRWQDVTWRRDTLALR